jgi:hypothetical protein
LANVSLYRRHLFVTGDLCYRLKVVADVMYTLDS